MQHVSLRYFCISLRSSWHLFCNICRELSSETECVADHSEDEVDGAAVSSGSDRSGASEASRGSSNAAAAPAAEWKNVRTEV